MEQSIENELKELELTLLGIDVPKWIDQDVTLYTANNVACGGCESGAYMPAVIYCKAQETMGEYGDDVLQYLDDVGLCEPIETSGKTWLCIACDILSRACDIWFSSIDSSEGEIIDGFWDIIQDSLPDYIEVIDDYGFDANAKLYTAGHQFGPTYLIVADSYESAWGAWIDETETVPDYELHEAYGFDTKEELQAHAEDQDKPDPELVEGYHYQANATGTGIVHVDPYATINPVDLSEVLDMAKIKVK